MNRYGRLELDGSVTPFCRRAKPHIRPLTEQEFRVRVFVACQMAGMPIDLALQTCMLDGVGEVLSLMRVAARACERIARVENVPMGRPQ